MQKELISLKRVVNPEGDFAGIYRLSTIEGTNIAVSLRNYEFADNQFQRSEFSRQGMIDLSMDYTGRYELYCMNLNEPDNWVFGLYNYKTKVWLALCARGTVAAFAPNIFPHNGMYEQTGGVKDLLYDAVSDIWQEQISPQYIW